MEIKNLNKIYVIHYEPLKERKLYLVKKMKELGLEKYTEWIISKKDEDVVKKDWGLYDSSKKALEEHEKIIGSKLPKIEKIDIIMTIQHLKIFKKIAEENKGGVSVIFEDDVLLSNNFPERLNETIQKLSKMNWDICYTDKGGLFIEPNIKKDPFGEITLYKPPERKSNTTGSYIINNKSLKKILKMMKNIAVGPDLEMSYIQKKNKLEVYWAIPFLTIQGSIEGIYQSNIRKGSITGILMKLARKINRISPKLGNFILNLSSRFRSLTYKSKLLIWLKDKFKRIIRL
jgi:GR25 family glycosyltransferase involved in LPS biosynthesis